MLLLLLLLLRFRIVLVVVFVMVAVTVLVVCVRLVVIFRSRVSVVPRQGLESVRKEVPQRPQQQSLDERDNQLGG